MTAARSDAAGAACGLVAEVVALLLAATSCSCSAAIWACIAAIASGWVGGGVEVASIPGVRPSADWGGGGGIDASVPSWAHCVWGMCGI
jgi:hypothetical protein